MIKENQAQTIDEPRPTRLPIYGNLEEVIFCAKALKASDWHLLPDQGGLRDQNATLMIDIFTYMDYVAEYEAQHAANQAGV